MIWFGENPHKGLGIFSYGPYRFQLLDLHNPAFKTILPIRVTGGKTDFTLFGVWANNPQDKKFQYIGQVWKALHFYADLLNEERVVLAGDFNSNTIWDKPKREGNHSTVVKFLEERNIHSAYHTFHQQQQGSEKHNTLFMYRHRDKPYHIDYCFASEAMINQVQEVKVGTHRKWARHSDHTPLVVSFDL
jgi:exonuclease III